MSSRFQGRRIVITGGSSGIGASVARRIVEEGGRVCVIHSDPRKMPSVAEGVHVERVIADVSDAAAAGRAIREAAAKLGGLDGVVNSAGVNTMKPFAETSAADWDRTIAVNLNGAFHICQAALDHLKQNVSATIVNVSSAIALQPLANRTAYAASKAGLIALSKVLAVELAPSIRVNVVCPGAVDTPMLRNTFPDPEAIARIAARYPLQRIATADEAANAVLFLTSHESSYITGATLTVDGGRTFH
jgi:NAD(P)-dependent dehydrogenase (short-subunit alcohol dehydrogenase family)